MDPAIIRRIVQESAVPESSVISTLQLLEAGATAPFLSRYGKEATGGLDESRIRAIEERRIHYMELAARRAALLQALSEQGKLSDDLSRLIRNCWDRYDIEDLHHRVRPKRKTKAVEAIEKGLEPLAEYIWSQDPDAWSLEEHADVFINPDKGIADRQQALQGAAEIIADWIADSFEVRKALRELLWKDGHVVSTVVPAKAGQKTKYVMYYDRREPVSTIPSHRVLAIRRGTKEGVLTSSIQCEAARAIRAITDLVIRDRESAFAPALETAARDSYSRILRPAIETEVRGRLKERADREAIRVFQENLENLLLSAPFGPRLVIGVDAGKGEECRLAAVDERGAFLEEAVVYPKPPKSDLEGTKTALADLIRKHNIQALAIGSGPAARETEKVLRGLVAEAGLQEVLLVAVNDAGVVVYSSSRIGREELPDLQPATRAAVSAARRLQDPLAELAKIDPKLIGVGQYQHDVDQKELHRRLVQTVQSCVNRVGVDLNTAGFPMLRYVSGISDRLARRIVTHRAASGPFPTREALKSVPGMDENTYRQAAAFLRVPTSEVPLDRCHIHPDCYPVVEKMAAALNISVAELIANREQIALLKLEDFVSGAIGLPTLEVVREELIAPARDPRGSFAPPRFHAEVRDIADLKEGTVLEGTVTNVTNFGAFVDIGIRQDGLVHLSQMSNRFIRDPREAVKVGDLVQVRVISVEVETKRIGLSMKALLPAVQRRRKRPHRRESPPAQAAAAEGGTPAAAEQPDASRRPPGPRRPFRTNRRPRPRHGEPRRPEAAENRPVPNLQVPEPDPEPKLPEPTLQEKIAILQSKFRGLS